MARVRGEAFWRQRLDREPIYIFPDLGGRNRYAGYTQHGTADDGSPAFIIHISQEALNAGEVDSVAATLVHELSHTVFDPSVIGRSLNPLLGSLSELIVEHPRLQALRRGAADPAEARAAQVRQIRQLLYERTAYGEAGDLRAPPAAHAHAGRRAGRRRTRTRERPRPGHGRDLPGAAQADRHAAAHAARDP
jgi:hypothetical protein